MKNHERVTARKTARTRLYKALYGACAHGVPHNNQPWHDTNRHGVEKLTESDFERLVKPCGFNQKQLARVNARFLEIK